MSRLSGRTWRIIAAMAVLWLSSALVVWLGVEPGASLVGAKASAVRVLDLAILNRADLSQPQAVLEKTPVWAMQRDGQAPAPVAPVVTVEKKIVWSIAAAVLRPKQKYLLVFDRDSKAITQVNVGDKLPDGSQLLQVAQGSYQVRTPEGKKRTIDISL
jgi:hypothetical protein